MTGNEKLLRRHAAVDESFSSVQALLLKFSAEPLSLSMLLAWLCCKGEDSYEIWRAERVRQFPEVATQSNRVLGLLYHKDPCLDRFLSSPVCRFSIETTLLFSRIKHTIIYPVSSLFN